MSDRTPASAGLVSAAPELYAALLELVTELDKRGSYGFQSGEEGSARARTALARVNLTTGSTTKPTTIRLSEQDRANAQTIIATGMARDVTSAVQVALGLVAHRIIKGR